MSTLHVSLQGEIPPQQEMKIGGIRGFVPYAATASLVASAMGAPPGMQVIAKLPDMAMIVCQDVGCGCTVQRPLLCGQPLCGRQKEAEASTHPRCSVRQPDKSGTRGGMPVL